MIERIRRLTRRFLMPLLGLALVSCGGGVDSGDFGTVRIGLTDLPSTAYSSVTITVKQVAVVSEESIVDAFTLDNPVSVNVLDYKDHSLRLGEGSVPATSYHQLRLVLVENPTEGDPVNYVMLNCDEQLEPGACDPDKKWPLKTPSGHTSGLKVLLPGNLVLGNGDIVLLTIDFDPGTAVVERGDWNPLQHEDKERFLIKPTGIRVTQEDVDSTYGILRGSVAFFDAPESGPLAVVTASDPTTLTPVAAAVVDPDNATDDFKLFLNAGDYNIHVRAEGYISESDGPFTVTESDTEPHPETDAGAFVLDPLVPGN